jgi:hypothetical protein
MRWRFLTGLFVLTAVLCTGAHVSRATASCTRRHKATSPQQLQPAKLPGPSGDVDDSLDVEVAPCLPGLVPTPQVSSLALPLLEPAAPRPPVMARNPPAPRRVKLPAPSADDVPES